MNRLCKYYNSPMGCGRGRNCLFTHERPTSNNIYDRHRGQGRCRDHIDHHGRKDEDQQRHKRERSRSKERKDRDRRKGRDSSRAESETKQDLKELEHVKSKQSQSLSSQGTLGFQGSKLQCPTIVDPMPITELSKKAIKALEEKKGANNGPKVNNEKSKEKIPKAKDKKPRHQNKSQTNVQAVIETPRSKELREKLEGCLSDSSLLHNSDIYNDLVTHGYVSFDRLQELGPLKQLHASESEIRAALHSSTLVEVAKVKPGVKRKGNQPFPKKLKAPKEKKVESTLLSRRNQEGEGPYF